MFAFYVLMVVAVIIADLLFLWYVIFEPILNKLNKRKFKNPYVEITCEILLIIVWISVSYLVGKIIGNIFF
jgi:Kef-type K+ transport system membrane component KefB